MDILTAKQVYEKLKALPEFSKEHPDAWRNEVANDLNTLMGRAIYEMEVSPDECDNELGAAVLRIVERVAEFEHIEPEGKHDE